MDDKTIMTNVLESVKGTCDLMLHGTIESSTPNVHATFKSELNNMLVIQNQIYAKMSEKGWYASEQAEAQKLDAAKQKFASA